MHYYSIKILKPLTLSITKNNIYIQTHFRNSKIVRIKSTFFIKLCKQKLSIKSYFMNRIIPVYYPYYADFVILDNLYLPIKGEYFLN